MTIMSMNQSSTLILSIIHYFKLRKKSIDLNELNMTYYPLNCFDYHDLNMNKDDENGGINVNPSTIDS